MLKKTAVAILLLASLNSYAQESFKILRGHHTKITSIAFSNNGKNLISKSNDNSTRYWEVGTQEEIKSFSERLIQPVFFSPDGKYMAYGFGSNAIKLVDAETEEILTTFSGHTNGITSIAFSPNGEYLASGSYDNTVKLWNIKSGKLVKTFQGHSDAIDALVFSADGNYLVSGGRDKVIRFWDIDKGIQIRIIPTTVNGYPLYLSLTFDGRGILSFNSNHSVKLFNIQDGQALKTFSINATAIAVSDRYLVCGSKDGSFALWNLETRELIKSLWNTIAPISSLSFSPDNKSIAVGSEDGMMRIWDISHLIDGEKSDLKFPPLLSIKKNSIVFADTDGNNRLDAGENATVEFVVVNSGKGAARGLRLVSQISGTNNDIFIYPSAVPSIEVNTEQTLSVIIKAGLHMPTGKTLLKLVVAEPNGLDSPPVEVEFNTLGFQPPKLVVADGVFSSESGNTIKNNYPVNLDILVQNIGEGNAEAIIADVKLPANVLNLDPGYHPIERLRPGETIKINTSFIVTARYTAKEVPIKIVIKEKYQQYGSEKDFVVQMDQSLATTNYVSVQGEEFKKALVTPASLHSEVDQDIPINPKKSENRFALVIGNENYQQFQTGLKSDQNVAYARNDAITFKEYLVKTMGFPENQVFLFTDATRAQMSRQLERLSELAKLNPGADLVFYYAGHGLPDQETREGYLVPVDVTASDIKDGISLKDMFSKLASAKAAKVVVFLDACFSGGGRGENGLLAARSVRIKPKGDIIEGNIIAFTAASGEEVSLPFNKESHGLFTYYLLRKFKETKGNVSMDELRNYLEKELPKASLLENSLKQTPQLLTAPDLGDTWLNWIF